MAELEVLVGRYEVVRVLSEGRRASVFQAIDRLHDRPVVLKAYPLEGSGDEDLMSEARVLMNLSPHAGVPTVRGDFFTDDPPRYVVVMNWVEGTNFQEVLDDEGDPGLPLPEVLDALDQVAEALDHLHAQDPPIVHGDVKPDNLIRAPGGRVVLVDFDIAAAESSAERSGTLGFVAPEVGAGEKPGPPADVYGLAATAVALLNGHGPHEAHPAYPGLAPAVQGQIARVLRSGIASDPVRRPKSARRLVANLRAAAAAAPPSGVVALLACEVAEAGRLWADDAEGMRTAMGRLRDVHERVVEEARGWVASSMNEGDRTVAVFREASAAAASALLLHERLAAASLPPGLSLELRVGLAVGEAELVEGVYVGAVVDQVLRLRAAAAPGTTVMSEPTAELLVGLVGANVAIVPLGTIDLVGAPGTRAFALCRPGEATPADLPSVSGPGVASARAGVPAEAGPPTPTPDPDPGRIRPLLAASGRAVQHPAALIPVTVAGVAAIYAVVLSSELGFSEVAVAAMVSAGLVALVAFMYQVAVTVRSERHAIEAARSRRAAEARRTGERRQLAERLAETADPDDAGFGAAVLDKLGSELVAVTDLSQRERTAIVRSLIEDVPRLAGDTYTHAVAAVSEAAELFEFAGGAHRRRLELELQELDRRLGDGSLGERERARDETRMASLRGLADRHEGARQRARDLLLEAERCANALGEARIGLASLHQDDERPDLDQVVGPLEDSIGRVRAVQDELRHLGY